MRSGQLRGAYRRFVRALMLHEKQCRHQELRAARENSELLKRINRTMNAPSSPDSTSPSKILLSADLPRWRELFTTHPKFHDATSIQQHLEDVTGFLTSQAEYDELMERYKLGGRFSQEEMVRRTANKVGLDVPTSN